MTAGYPCPNFTGTRNTLGWRDAFHRVQIHTAPTRRHCEECRQARRGNPLGSSGVTLPLPEALLRYAVKGIASSLGDSLLAIKAGGSARKGPSTTVPCPCKTGGGGGSNPQKPYFYAEPSHCDRMWFVLK